jgi:hypothetical protein
MIGSTIVIPLIVNKSNTVESVLFGIVNRLFEVHQVHALVSAHEVIIF